MKKKLTCSYLYEDGHAVLVYEKIDPDAGRISFCEVHEKLVEGNCGFTGRLIFSRYDSAMLDICKKAHAIRAHEASLDSGSDNTKRLGISYGYLEIWLSNDKTLNFTELPGTISGSYTYQPRTVEACPTADGGFWGSLRISKFHPAKKEPLAIAA